MAKISSLPVELLDIIFRYLGSIDDVHHLGRTCKSIYRAISSQSDYTKIMRCIIGNAPEHRFDVSLCKVLALHCKVVRHFQNGHGPIVATQPGQELHDIEVGLTKAVDLVCSERSCLNCLPDDRIYEILARYQGLRILEDEWLARELSAPDSMPITYDTLKTDYLELYETIRAKDDEFRYDGADPRPSPETSTYTSFNSDHRRRFHAAVTSLWLLNEIRWVLTHFETLPPHFTFTLQLQILDACKNAIEGQSETPIVDDLDRHAVFRFLYHHMLPLYASVLADRPVSFLPLTYPSTPGLTQAKQFQFFLAVAQAHLQPPDLIDLLVRSRTSRKRPYPTLPLPFSTTNHQRPHIPAPFPTYDSPVGPHDYFFSVAAETHLNLLARASLNQSLYLPQQNIPAPVSGGDLYALEDGTADYLEENVMRHARILGGKQELWQEEWDKVWWRVWWWAGSFDKAREKMVRVTWRRQHR